VTTVAVPSSPAPPTSVGRQRRLSVHTTDDPDVLLRVLTVLRRRGFAVHGLEFRAGDRHAPARLDVTVEAQTRLGHQLEAWLLNVVGVLSVTDRP
jgi:acetolactate synthase regulatory subunit